MRELRGLSFGPDNNLYIVNSYRSDSKIVRFNGTVNPDGTHDFIDTFVSYDATTNPGLDHPFSLAFSTDGNLFVSSQDTSVVTQYWGPTATGGTPGSPTPLASSLPPSNPTTPYPPGTFVASQQYTEPGNGVLKSVRDSLFGPDGDLYIADPLLNQVFKYDGTTGEFIAGLFSSGQQTIPWAACRLRLRTEPFDPAQDRPVEVTGPAGRLRTNGFMSVIMKCWAT